MHSADPASGSVLDSVDPASGVDLICIKSALSVLDIDLPIQAAYTTAIVLILLNFRLGILD